MASVNLAINGSFPVLQAQDWGGGAIIWAGNRTNMPAGDGSSRIYPVSSVFGTNGALAKIASYNKAANRTDGVGGTILVAPGHVESIAASTNLSTLMTAGTTGVKVIGLGNGQQRPIFNWTAAASALLINLAGTWFRNCKFNLSSTAATVVTAAITVSATDCGFEDVEMLTATSATQLTTTAMTIATGGTRFTQRRVKVLAETFATNPTDICKTTAAVDQFTMEDCDYQAAVNSTTTGVLFLATAPTNVNIKRCTFNNKIASSTKCLVASTSSTGLIANSFGLIQTTGAATAFGTLGNLALFECYGATLTTAGILIGTPAT
jgi:hypothetical protein